MTEDLIDVERSFEGIGSARGRRLGKPIDWIVAVFLAPSSLKRGAEPISIARPGSGIFIGDPIHQNIWDPTSVRMWRFLGLVRPVKLYPSMRILQFAAERTKNVSECGRNVKQAFETGQPVRKGYRIKTDHHEVAIRRHLY